MKKLKDKITTFLCNNAVLIAMLVIIVLSYFVAYKIAVSDLPFWLKFVLLK